MYTSFETFSPSTTSSDTLTIFVLFFSLSRRGFLVQVLKEHLTAASPISFQLSHEEPKSKLKAGFLHKVGLLARLQITSGNSEIQAEIPVTSLTWAGIRHVATPICPFSLPASHSHTHDPLLPFTWLYNSYVSLPFLSVTFKFQSSHVLSFVLESRSEGGWVARKENVGNEIFGLTLCFCRMHVWLVIAWFRTWVTISIRNSSLLFEDKVSFS